MGSHSFTCHPVLCCTSYTTVLIVNFYCYILHCLVTEADMCKQSVQSHYAAASKRPWIRDLKYHTTLTSHVSEIPRYSATHNVMLHCTQQFIIILSLWLANWPWPALDLQLRGDHYVGKPSAEDQPTRPTQPYILLGSINE